MEIIDPCVPDTSWLIGEGVDPSSMESLSTLSSKITMQVENVYKVFLNVPDACLFKPDYTISIDGNTNFAAIDAANGYISITPTEVELAGRSLLVNVKAQNYDILVDFIVYVSAKPCPDPDREWLINHGGKTLEAGESTGWNLFSPEIDYSANCIVSTNIQFDNNGHEFIEFYDGIDVVMINGEKTVNLNEKDFTYYVTFNEKKYEMPLTINYAEPNNTESGAVEQNNTVEEPAPAQNETKPAESTTPTNTTTESEKVAEAVNVNEEDVDISKAPMATLSTAQTVQTTTTTESQRRATTRSRGRYFWS